MASQRATRALAAKAVVAGFALAVLVGTILLLLPVSRAGAGGAPPLVALFTATSAVCVTGLTVVDTATYWSEFGQGVILGLIQLGGIGILTAGSVLLLGLSRRLGLRGRLLAQAETRATNLGQVRNVLLTVVLFSAAMEAILATGLAIRFWTRGDDFATGLWRGVFHAVSAFNNAGFALFSDNLTGFVSDPAVNVLIALGVIAGGLGFPVWLELRRSPRKRPGWSLHTKLTLATSAILLVGGAIVLTALEWTNEKTIGSLDPGSRIMAGAFASVMPRTAGFNAIDYADARGESLLVTDMLMMVGGGSASTAGGIKVTTMAVLLLIVLAEIKGRGEVEAFRRRISSAAQRQALTIAFVSVNIVVIGALILMATSTFSLSQSLFETISAFATVGLTTGITPLTNDVGRILLIALMFIGRVGPLTLAVALALREHERPFRYPEERPIVG